MFFLVTLSVLAGNIIQAMIHISWCDGDSDVDDHNLSTLNLAQPKQEVEDKEGPKTS